MSSSERHSGGPADADWLHFAGIAGSGMSALAQFHALRGGRISGSDRAFDQGQRTEIRRALEQLGAVLVPQDGTFAVAAAAGDAPCRGLVVSTAVEDRVPDVVAARAANIPILHRSELLARHVADHRSVAVTGTSGKSTVTAMIFTILRACGRGPGLLTGGPVAELIAAGYLGNAWAPDAADTGPPLLVVEADESDGSVVRYRPWLGVVLNLGLDHKEPAEILAMFRTFRANTRGTLVVGDQEALAPLHRDGILFGESAGCRYRAVDVELGGAGSTFTVADVGFTLPCPGRHNVLNATAAIAACAELGVPPADMVAPLAGFGGVSRRFQSLGTAGGVEVIDDFAHNPDKILATLATAHRRTTGRVLAVFQPHGFGPTRFLRDALVAAFGEGLAGDDVLWLPEIFYAGGTVERDISSADLAAAIDPDGRRVRFVARREDLPSVIAAEARAGDLVVVMGARDPSLTGLARRILASLDG